MEGYGRGGRGRGGERGRGRGRHGGGNGGHGGGHGGAGYGGRGRGYQQQQQQPQQAYQPHQQTQFRQPSSQGNVWAQGGPNLGRGGPSWRPNSDGRGQGSVGPNTQNFGGAVGAGGAGAVGGGSYAGRVQSSSFGSSAVDPGTIVPKMQSLKVSEHTYQTLKAGGIVPMKRPDNGGVARIRTIKVLVNHFPVEFNPETEIGHYDINVKPVAAPAKGRPVKISKSNLCLIMDKVFAENRTFPPAMTAYDGEKNIFSTADLPTGEFRVELPGDDDTRSRTYIFCVKLVNKLKLHKLSNYLTGDLLQIPRDVLQGMDVVMKENPRRNMISIGRTFHPKDRTDCNLGGGIAASRGFQHTLKPTSQGLALCLDYSVLAVRRQLPVLDFLTEHVPGFRLDSFHKKRKYIESVLKGLKVTVIHRRTKQKYTVSGLTNKSAGDISFTTEDPSGQMPPRSVQLVNYFQEKYRTNIQYKDIPCLMLGKGSKANYVPIELCVLVEGQRFPKDNLDRNSALTLKDMSLAAPEERKSTICSMLQAENGPCGGDICKNFGIEVRTDMTRLEVRVIGPPQLKLRATNGNVIAVPLNESCQWNLNRNCVVEGTSLVRWAVLDFSQGERYDQLNKDFIWKLVERCNKLGLHMDDPLFVEPAGMSVLGSAGSLTQLFEKVQDRARGDLQLLLCVMTRKDPGYKYIKWISETKIGIVTQCCLSKMANKSQDQYLANVGMKINAKLGGSNVELYRQFPLYEDDNHVMLIGADVNHPRPLDFLSPSIAAVVASMNWPAANKYSPRVRFQQHRSEKIIDFGEICLELINSYEKLNNVKPGKIVIFRDGVSEAQFDMVLNEELLDLKKALEGKNYNPTITLVVARKRHQTRLFPATARDGGNKGNIPPGTVVDKTIVHPFEFDFYLCSHYGGIGTTKATHYHVLWDEHNFSSDKLQELIYNLCFTFARCCKPVSLVPPVFYADLLAYRGRLYYDARSENSSSGSSSSSLTTSSSSTSGASWDENIGKVHADLEDSMFFI